MRKKGRKAFWHNFKFKYRLIIVNENTLEEVFGLHVSKLNGLSVLLAASTLIFLLAAAIIVFTPLRNYLPGYMDSRVRERIVDNSLRADSLLAALERQERYAANIRAILSGEISPDSIPSVDTIGRTKDLTPTPRSAEETEFCNRYEEDERYNLTAVSEERGMGGLVFYRPVRGIISRRFNPADGHFGIDVTDSPHESILADLDGTVVFAAYTAQWRHVLQIQHEQGFVSIYKLCGMPVCREGDKVRSGQAVALVGKANVENEKPHLHYELWYRGTPVNPEKYIAF